MPSRLERVDPNTVRLHVEIAAEDLEKAVAGELRRRGASLRLRGFRPGKAPVSLLRRYIGGEVMADVAGELMQNSVVEAVRQHDLALAAPAKIEVADREQGDPLRFSATLEVHEQPRDVDLTGLEVVRRVPVVDEAAVMEQLERLRDLNARSIPVEPPRPAQKGDVARIDITMRFDDKLQEQPMVREGIEVEVGGPHFLLDLMKETLVGLEVGNEKTGQVTFPEDYMVRALAGRTGTAAVVLRDLAVRKLPALDDEFARDLGVEDLATLKERVREELRAEADEFADREVDRELMDAVVERAGVSLPPTWTEERLKEHEETFRKLLAGSGEIPEVERNLLRQEAERRLREAVVIGWLARKKGLHATQEDIEARVAKIAQASGRPLAQVRAEVASKGAESITAEVTEEKVRAAIRAAASVKEGPPLPTAERKGRRRAGRAAKEPR